MAGVLFDKLSRTGFQTVQGLKAAYLRGHGRVSSWVQELKTSRINFLLPQNRLTLSAYQRWLNQAKVRSGGRCADLRLRAEHEPINPAVMCLGGGLVLSRPFQIIISFLTLLFRGSEGTFASAAAPGSAAVVKRRGRGESEARLERREVGNTLEPRERGGGGFKRFASNRWIRHRIRVTMKLPWFLFFSVANPPFNHRAENKALSVRITAAYHEQRCAQESAQESAALPSFPAL